MEDKRFQITTFGGMSQFGRLADRSISAGLTWEDALMRLENSPDANIDYCLTSMSYKKTYSFHDSEGHENELSVHA